MPASAEDLKARVRRAQRRARRERARQRALLGPGWGLPASVEASLDRKKLLDALTRDGGPMPGARTSDQSRRAIRAASEVAKAEAIKARARKEKRDLTPEETRHVADLNRGALEIANAGPGNPGENALTLFVGPSVASWLPGGIPRQGGAGSLALEAALFALPTKGVGRILGRSARAAGIPTRTLAARGFQATIPAARSIPGRAVERAIDRVRPETWTLRRIARETAFNRTAAARVTGAPGAAAANIGRHLNAGQAKTLQILADGVPIDTHLTRHRGWLDDATRAGDKKAETLHRIHLRLVEKAARYIDDSTGVPQLRHDVPDKLRDTWALVRESGELRSGIVRELGMLTDETLLARLSKPGRVMLGAEWKDEALTGAEHFTGGGAYVPDVRGVPAVQPATIRSLTRQAQVYARGGWRRRISGRVTDPTLTHEYTGLLRKSGLFRTDVHNLSHDALGRALKLDTIRWYRDHLLQGATDTPRHITDVPIAVKPGSRVPAELKEFWDTWELVQGGGLTRRQVRQLGGDRQIQEFLDQLFPKNLPAVGIAAPVPGVKWVPAELVQNSPVANPLAGRVFSGGPAAGVVGDAIDLMNDYVKAAILFGNPAYSPVQLVQNVALNVIQQGVFLPVNWARAARALAKVSPANRQALLDLTQAGHASVLQAKKMPINRVAKIAMFIADRYPRMASFMHEAARAGYRKPAEIDALLNAARAAPDGEAAKQVTLITRRAVDAVGDFERLGAAERNILARWLFVYPWLKAATRLTYRMPLDHPWQSAAFGYAGYKLKEYADAELGDRPHYAEWDIPIPGMVDENGNPYTINIARLFPWETPANLTRAAIGGATGLGEYGPQILDQLQPTVQATITALTGRDDFGREVGKGLPTFARETWESLPPARFYRAFTTPEEKKREQIYPRSTRDEIVRLAAGSLAPKPYNVEKAQAVAHGKTRTAGSYVRQAMREAERFSRDHSDLVPKEALPAVERALTIRARVSDKQSEMRRNQKVKELTDRQEYAAKLSVLQELRPELGIDDDWWGTFRTVFEQAPQDGLDRYKTYLNGLLELEDVYQFRVLSFLERQRQKAREIERAERIAEG